MLRRLCCLLLSLVASSVAAAPENPGFYRMKLGEFEIVALSDGTHPFPVESVMVGASGDTISAALEREALALPLQGSINAFLIDTGAQRILIDTGAGILYGDCCGRVMASLGAAGYRPEQVDLVLLTHLHKDHVGGVLQGGAIAFPKARLFVAAGEAAYWHDPAARGAAPAFLRTFFDAAGEALAPWASAGRLQTFTGETVLAPGIRSISAAGHTPGHAAYLVESRGERLLVWGDVVHVAAVQLGEPQVAVKYDSDTGAAIRTRQALLARAARDKLWVAAAHLAFPGLGHLRRDGNAYRWIPVNYETMPTAR